MKVDIFNTDKKYTIIYADPPWAYKVWSNKGNGRSAESHYNTMKIEEIINMKDTIQKISDENCVLFLWVTFPCLLEGLRTLKSGDLSIKLVDLLGLNETK